MKRAILRALLTAALTTTGNAQQPVPAPATVTTTTATTATTSPAMTDAAAVRDEFSQLLRRLPTEVPSVLALDPTLLNNETYVAGYPDIAAFLTAHPEVHRNPRYYVGEYHFHERTTADQALELLGVFFGFGIGAFTIVWLVRTVVEHRRWARLAHMQSEAHNKILDRFGSSTELLEYIRSPAGTKFLESAPIAASPSRPMQSTSVSRVIWSVQLGIVVTAGAAGALLVSRSLPHPQALLVLGTIALCVGLGFIASAAVSVFVSRRLGVWEPPAAVDGMR